MLQTIQTTQMAAIHPFSEKKMINISTTVASTLTKSGIVCATKFSIFSIFCSIVFLIAPVEVPFRYPSESRPICSDKRMRNP